MPLGRYLLAPIFVFNLAGEMLYILNQRLKAQNIQPQKASKVLTQIGGAVYKQQFVQELMKNQRPLPISFLKDLFHQLVHTSIMKLNEVSMSKLFDLMLMCFKAQVFLSSSPAEIYTITINHMKEVMRIIQKGPAIKNIEQSIATFKQKFQQLPVVRYVEIRQQTLQLLEPYHVRISILLQEQFQNEDGTLIHYNRYACYAGKPVGSIEYPLKGFIVKEKIGPCDEDLKPMKGKDFKDWSSELGFNIYQGNYPLRSQTSQKSKPNDIIKTGKIINSSTDTSNEPDRTLSNLILGSRAKQNEEECFTLDLFVESKTGIKSDQSALIDTQILQQRPKINNSFKQKILAQLDKPSKPTEEEQQDDLLSMMDKATSK